MNRTRTDEAKSIAGRIAMGTSCLLATIAVGMLAAATPAERDTAAKAPEQRSGVIELPEQVRIIESLKAVLDPVDIRIEQPIGGAATGACLPVEQAYTDADFDGGAYTVQAGFAQNNVAAISVTLEPDAFPVRIDKTEMIFATSGTSVTTTTKWSLLVWSGTPSTGTLVNTFSSDDVILPHIVLPPGTSGVNVQVMVDPGDPEQIIIPNDGSNTFSIGYRIDEHNNPSGFSPNCLPAPEASNAFPVTDTYGLSAPTNNWVGSPNCDPFFGCVTGGGYMNFQDLSAGCTPSGDWVMRVTYTPLNCPTIVGACCLPGGGCQILESIECANLGGNFQGEGLTCVGIDCPEPTGACCTGGGACSDLSQADCAGVDGSWGGVGTNCASGVCTTGTGACCIPGTGECVDFTEADCEIVSGVFGGVGTQCNAFVCFPIGACCLGDGDCVDGVDPEACEMLEGTFQGDASLCDSAACPLPEGACCLANGNCLVLTANTCSAVGGTWAEPGTDCTDSNSSGIADACEDDAPCVGDLTGDSVVDVSDLLVLLSAWGPCNGDCPSDLNGDKVVDVSDLLILLSAWGACP